MNYKPPDFDELLALSRTDPDALDRIKQEASQALVSSASEYLQNQLNGLQIQIDMELRRSKSGLDGCIRISRIMHKSLQRP